ncbi:MAG TPA: sulfite exporter TauE/SafE family protein [Thermomicrobiales bacterium]|nr:sulfite exporter TauE/SafE family protein [Thermomicrobiales bacterium]
MCFAVGTLLGFIGAGGAGVMVALLTIAFDLPIDQAVGTALASMVVVSISGAISHYREQNINIRAGVVVGLSGMIGAIVGADIGQAIPEHVLQPAAGFALWFLAFLMWARTRFIPALAHSVDETGVVHTPQQLAGGAALGISGGLASAFFGVGMAPFIQLGMLTVMKLSLVQTVGTTMMALIFISLSGSIALASHGDVSWTHMTGVAIGMTAGSFVGAKLTRRAPPAVLRVAVIATPFVAGTLLVFG